MRWSSSAISPSTVCAGVILGPSYTSTTRPGWRSNSYAYPVAHRRLSSLTPEMYVPSAMRICRRYAQCPRAGLTSDLRRLPRSVAPRTRCQDLLPNTGRHTVVGVERAGIKYRPCADGGLASGRAAELLSDRSSQGSRNTARGEPRDCGTPCQTEARSRQTCGSRRWWNTARTSIASLPTR